MRKNKDTKTDNNLYYNVPTIEDLNGPIIDANRLNANPMFVNMHGDKLEDYQLLTDSPAIRAGRLIPDNGGRDFFGNPVFVNDPPSIGADNGNLTVGIFDNSSLEEEMFMIYPNITKSNVFIDVKDYRGGMYIVSLVAGQKKQSKRFIKR